MKYAVPNFRQIVLRVEDDRRLSFLQRHRGSRIEECVGQKSNPKFGQRIRERRGVANFQLAQQEIARTLISYQDLAPAPEQYGVAGLVDEVADLDWRTFVLRWWR